MKINSKEKIKKTLDAVPVNHEMAGFESKKTEYSIFNSSMDAYHVILPENAELNEVFRAVEKFVTEQREDQFVIDGDSFLKFTENRNGMITSLVSAIEYGSVTPWSMKSDEKKALDHVLTLSDAADAKYAEEKLIVSQAQTTARRLQDMPSNLMVPERFVTEVKEVFKDLKNVKITVLERPELEKKGMNLHVGVGQGATRPEDQPRLMVIEYMGNPDDSENRVAFVGKGVCFDSGGYNLKPGNHMRWMKYDMSGAAICAMTVYALAKNSVRVNAYAVCPLVLNLISSVAQRPDDVIKSYSGKSVEIDNTDAEGRLILADALTYAARDLQAKRLLEISTLTGAMVYALGDTFTGVWSTKDKMWERIEEAAQESGELVWRMPFHHDFKDLLKSKYADIANSVSDIRGGSIRAAEFLRSFTDDLPYSHFDIAGTGDRGNSGTGAMLQTFYNFAKICSLKSGK